MTLIHPSSDIQSHASGSWIAARPLQDFPWLKHCSTTRSFNTPGANRTEELIRLRSLLNCDDSALIYAEQKHTSNVGIVTPEIVQSCLEGLHGFKETDALVTQCSNVMLTIMTADCAPIFLVDPVRKIIGLVHAGWKGTYSRIASQTVSAMKELGSVPSDVISWVGPMAGGCCYEVSDELLQQFENEFHGWPVRFNKKPQHLDLVEINCLQLEQSGLLYKNVHRSNICTIHNNERFYSYRADQGTTGRIISAFVMLP